MFKRPVIEVANQLQQCRGFKHVLTAKLQCKDCYFSFDHRTDTKLVLCKNYPKHKQIQRNSTEFRLRQKYYFYGMRDLGAPAMYINTQLHDIGYYNYMGSPYIVKNNKTFDGLKARAKEFLKAPISSDNDVVEVSEDEKRKELLLRLQKGVTELETVNQSVGNSNTSNNHFDILGHY